METPRPTNEPPSSLASDLTAFADYILAHHEDITRHWVGAVDRNTQIDSSAGLTFRQLLDHFPELCAELANVLKAPAAESPRVQATEQSAAHGRKRWQQGYRLDEAIRELCVVRRDFRARWLPAFEQERGALPPENRQAVERIIHQFFDDALVESTTQFVEEQHHEIISFQKTLLEQKQLLDEADSLKTRFLSLVSHELRTPLTPVLLELAALRSDPRLPPHCRQSVDHIEHSIHLEAALIDDLLDATRLAQGGIALRLVPVDVHDIIHGAARACRHDFASKEVALDLRLQASERTLRGDEARLLRSFTALLRNAVNVSPVGARVLVTSRNSEGAHEIEVAVQDSGDVFAEGTAQAVFDPFEEGRRSAIGTGGLGVGRYVAKGIVVAHGGTLTAAPAAGERGAIYLVRLPVQS